MPKYPENLIHFCNPVLEHYELDDEMGRMFVRSMIGQAHNLWKTLVGTSGGHSQLGSLILKLLKFSTANRYRYLMVPQ